MSYIIRVSYKMSMSYVIRVSFRRSMSYVNRVSIGGSISVEIRVSYIYIYIEGKHYNLEIRVKQVAHSG